MPKIYAEMTKASNWIHLKQPSAPEAHLQTINNSASIVCFNIFFGRMQQSHC